MVVCACSPSYSGGWGRRIAWTQEAEVAVSQDRAIALQSGEQEQDSISKNKNKKRQNDKDKETKNRKVAAGGYVMKRREVGMTN